MSHFKKRSESKLEADGDVMAPFPKNCLAEVTNACNHACVFCHNPFMHRKSGILDLGLFGRFVREAHALGLEEIGLYSTGEPFLVKNIEDYVKIAKDAGLRRIYITTNGAMATLERVQTMVSYGLDSIKFSINAATRESYHVTHGRDEFDLVTANLRAIHDWKSDAGIPLQVLGSFIYTDVTEGEIPLYRELFTPYFEDIIFQRAQSQGGRTGPNIEGLVTYPAHPDVQTPGPCWMLWNRIHITCEGLLSACCVDYEHDLTYGDFASSPSLSEMWNGVTMQNLRSRHLKADFDNTICKSCLLGGQHPYRPISDIRGKFSDKGRFEDETRARIADASAALKRTEQ